MTNRLAGETSPYLRQHAQNPVDWYPWGTEALAAAQTEGKPILVSIGYSACHWCHVMAHESFENEQTAALMNEHFINIKVDREERPDVDSIYMEAVQALTGSGGWPLNVFLTPDGRPFFGGTYFPPQPRHGLPSWPQVLAGVAETYVDRPDDILHNAGALTTFIEQAQRQGESEEPLGPEVVSEAYDAVARQFDLVNGGFGSAPKFPQPLGLEFVLRRFSHTRDPRALEFMRRTLDRMAAGGIHDHIGGGFHRYSVDNVWLAPHFEKMLYDNALLARVYTTAFQATSNPGYRVVAEHTLDYLMRDLRSPRGAFFSSQDADSDGVEGRYYVWTLDELCAVLGSKDGALAAQYFGVTAEGNFDGKSILTTAATPEEVAEGVGLSVDEAASTINRLRATLLEARETRTPPHTDTKILVSWNALAIRALAEAGRIFGRPDYLDAATTAMRFILTSLRPSGRLVRSYLDGPGDVAAFLEDYAFLVEALITLYMTAFDREYLGLAEELAQEMAERFHDEERGAFYDTASDSSSLIIRPRSLFDNPIPSGNSAAAFAFVRLEALTGSARYGDHARSIWRASRRLLARAPLTVSYALSALDFQLSPPSQIAVAGNPYAPDTNELVSTVFQRYLPNAVVAVGAPDSMPLLFHRELRDGRATAYVCEHFVCQTPVTNPVILAAQLDVLTR